MTKDEFLNALTDRLGALGEAERAKCAAYYDEMLSDRIEEGMDEQAAVAGMEPIDEIARRIISSGVPNRQAASEESAPGEPGGWRLALLILSAPLWMPLLAAALLAAAMLLLALWMLWLGLAISTVSMLAAGAASALAALSFLVRQPASGLFMLGLGLTLTALGLLLYRPMTRSATGAARLTQRAWRALRRGFHRREAM